MPLVKAVRSGCRSRWLVFPGAAYTAVTGEFVFWNLFFGVLLLGGFCVTLVVAGVLGALRFSDPHEPLWELHRPLTPAEVACGRVRLCGKLHGDSGDVPPLCLVVQKHKSGKSTYVGWRGTVSSFASVVDGEGQKLQVGVAHARWEPEHPSEEESREAAWRARVGGIPSGGWIEDQCVHQGERVFLDGCRRIDESGQPGIGSCPAQPLVITVGDGTAQPRIDERASDLLGRVALLAAAAMLLLLYGWRIIGSRPLVQALLRWSRADRLKAEPRWRKLAITLVIAGPIMAFLVDRFGKWFDLPWYPQGSRVGHLIALAVLALGALLVLVVRKRHRRLRAAMVPILDAPTVPLSQAAEGQLVELAVQIKSDAPLVQGPLTDKPWAFAGVTVERVYRHGKNHASKRESDQFAPALIPVMDESGEGMLDMKNAECDFPAVRHVAKSAEVASGRHDAVLGAARKMPHSAFEIEERHVAPGDTLYVLGKVHRREVGPGEALYRAACGVPVVGATDQAKLIVHAGTERDLLAVLRRERGYLDLVFALLAALTLTVLVAIIATTAM